MLFKKVLNSTKNNNKGMSLVEVVCAIAILGLTTTVITSAMRVGMQSYDRGIQETDLQKDAQLLVNQISDLVIDSSSDVSFDSGTNTLIVKQGTREFRVRYDTGDQKLYYSDSDAPGVEQVLADGVSSFGIDVDDFARRGNLGVSVGFVSDDGTRDFSADYTITCRNGNGTSTAVVVRARIVCPDHIIIEPGQVLNFNDGCSVTGGAGSLRYEIIPGTGEATGTFIDGDGKIHCDPDQEGRFKVKVSTTSAVAGVPDDTKVIEMQVRRVDEIKIHGGCTSGTERTAGATYQLYVDDFVVSFPDKDNYSIYDEDYKTPYDIRWEVVSGDVSSVQAYGTNNRNLKFTLNSAIEGTNSVKIVAHAVHATDDGHQKCGTHYNDRVIATYELNPGYIYSNNEGGGILRMDHEPQASMAQSINALKQSYESAGRNVGWKFSFSYKMDAEGATRSDWIYCSDVNNWSDADNSMALNLRGAILTMMDRDHGYDIWVRFQIVDFNTGEVLWPTANDVVTDGMYITHGYMEKFGAKFDSTYLNMTAARTNYNANEQYPVISVRKGEMIDGLITLSGDLSGNDRLNNPFLGYDPMGTSLTNMIEYKIQKKVNGTWVDCSSSQVWCQNPCPQLKIKFEQDNFGGSYRVLTSAKEMPKYEFKDGRVNNVGNDYDVHFYNDEYIDGVYYFNVLELN